MKYYRTLKRDSSMISTVKKESRMVVLQVDLALVIYLKCLEEEEGSSLAQERESPDFLNLKLLFLKYTTELWKMSKLPEQEIASNAMEKEERTLKSVVNAKGEE